MHSLLVCLGVFDNQTMYSLSIAHISPCGNHLAILLFLGARLVIVPHFRRYAGNPDWEQMMYESALDIQLGSPRGALGVYLAYEEGDAGVGKIGVVSVSRSVFPTNNNLIGLDARSVRRFPPLPAAPGRKRTSDPCI